MKELFDYISVHPYVGIILILLIALTIFVWVKAIASGKKRNSERDKIIADLEREKKLRNEFRNLSDDTFSQSVDDYRLVIGLCANIQIKLEKEPDMVCAFKELSDIKKYAYTLGYVFEDGKNKMSDFFRLNGEPLLSTANEAVKIVIGGEFAEIFSKEYTMLDENDETTSVDNEKLDEYDRIIRENIKSNCVYKKAADYFRDNKANLI